MAFTLEDKTAIGHFDIINNDLWFVTHDGRLGFTDSRATQTEGKQFNVSEKKLNTIHINPIKTQNICIAGLDGFVRLFDLRKIIENEPVKIFEHDKSVNSAYWSPDGMDIASTSFDDTVAIWKHALEDHEHLSIKHNNRTGFSIFT
jgi:WD40 repeat protein